MLLDREAVVASSNGSVIARVIVGVRDQRIEDHAAAQFAGVVLRLPRNSKQFFGRQNVGPAVSVLVRVFGAQDRQAAHHPGTQIAVTCLFAVEALDEQHVAACNMLDAVWGGADAAGAGEPKHGVLDTRVVPLVIATIEFCEPKPVRILDDGIRARAAHLGADQHQVFDLSGLRAVRQVFAGDDCVGVRDQPFKIERLVELSSRSGGLGAKAESECACAAIRSVEQLVDLFELRHSSMFFDDAAPPMVRTGIAQRAEHAL